jgi:AraC-like DNA-binding protein
MDIIDPIFGSINLSAGLPFLHLVILMCVNWIFYKKFRQAPIPMSKYKEKKLESSKKMMDSYLLEEEFEQEILKIKGYMETEQPYLNPGLTLKRLATKLEIPARKLSSILNHEFNKNFAGFINDYRIEMAKERLKNPIDDKETIQEIMYEVGFNSKSSFNTLFKQKTGRTPTEYRKRNTIMQVVDQAVHFRNNLVFGY